MNFAQKKATFYLLNSKTNFPLDFESNSLSLLEKAAIFCVIAIWKEKKSRILIACETQTQAENIDEFLWQNDSIEFIPHNLVGEGPKFGAPIEITWKENSPKMKNRPILINLQTNYSLNFSPFSEIIDFVPIDENEKIAARNRYKNCKIAGFEIETKPFLQNE